MPNNTTVSRKDRRPFSELDIDDQVRRAMPIAKQIALYGLGDIDGLDPDDEHLFERIAQVAGLKRGDLPDVAEPERQKFEDFMRASYVLGIAIGQLVSPALFAKEIER